MTVTDTSSTANATATATVTATTGEGLRLPAPSTTAGAGARWRTDVQGLRAVAVLLVVLYHAGVPGLPGGYVGVDVFFVISGYLITGHLLRDVERTGRVRLGAFWAGRIRRLAPMATLVLVVTLVVARLWGPVFQLRELAREALLTAVYGINYALALEGVDYGAAGGPETPLQHYWSLAVEEQFYLLWPLLVAGCVLVARRRPRRALAVGLAVVVVGSFVVSVRSVAAGSPFAYFGLHTRAWELAVGALLAVAPGALGRLRPVPAAVLGWAGLAAVVAAAVLYTDRTPFPGAAAAVPVLGAAAVLAAGERGTDGRAVVARLLRLRPMQWLGAVSYGLYLWHWPALVLVPQLLGVRWGWLANLQLVVLSLWLSVVSLWLLERPVRTLRLPTRRWFAVGAALLAAAGLTAGAVALTVPGTAGHGRAARSVSIEGADGAALAAQVLASSGLTEVPVNLAPALDVARGDQPASSADGCHATYEQVDQPTCEYGDPAGARTVVLFGDSHAQQWLPGLSAAGTTDGWRVLSWTKAACSAADVELFNADIRRAYTECSLWRDRTVARIVDLAPDLVVVSQSDTVPGEQLDARQWSEATAATLGRLTAAGVPVVLLLDTPYPGIDVPECLATHLDDAGACVVPRADVVPYEARREAVQGATAALGITTVDPTDWMCTPQVCPPVVGNTLVYRDVSHITATYSAWLAPMLAPLVPAATG